MKTIKQMLITLAVLLCSVTASAKLIIVNGISYDANNYLMEATVVEGDTKHSGHVVIPNIIEDYDGTTYRVTTIGNRAFQNCTALTNVTIPNSIKTIRSRAFYGCTALTNVTIPNSVTTIENDAFQNCKNLERVEINSQGTSSCFKGLTSIKQIIIGNNVTDISDYAFAGCSSLTSVTIGERVSRLGYHSFADCPSLTSIKIPSSVSYIGHEVFYGCTGLKYIEIPNSVTEIGAEAFEECSGLTSIVIPNSVNRIGNGAFHGCTSLKDLRIEDGKTTLKLGYEAYSYNGGKGLFYDCPLEIIYLGRNIDYETQYFYGNSPFYNKEELKSLTIGNSVTKLGDYAFRGCSSLINIYLTRTTPPSVSSKAFTEALYTNTTIYVPQSSLTTYQSSQHWKKFLNIEEYNSDRYFHVSYIVDGEPYAVDSVKRFHAIILKERPVKEGYTFSGWSEAPTTMPAEDITIEGTFYVNNYIVTYIINGEVYEVSTVEYGSKIELPSVPEKEGYTFSGWENVPETMPAKDIVIQGNYIVDTAVEEIYLELGNIEVYNLKGLRITETEKLTRGIYIINGKKTFVK